LTSSGTLDRGSPGCAGFCDDTDGGDDPNVPGTVTKGGTSISDKDYCFDLYDVDEYYCNGPSTPADKIDTCALGRQCDFATGACDICIPNYAVKCDASTSNLYNYNGCGVKGSLYKDCSPHGCDLGASVCNAGQCGDGTIDTGEQCDDGSSNTNTACTAGYGSTCKYCDTSCKSHTVTGPYCGDGAKQSANEKCDNSTSTNNYNTDTACNPTYGGSACTYCDTSCKSHSVTAPKCGDSIVQSSEDCDLGSGNTNGCPAPYGGSCSYCDKSCAIQSNVSSVSCNNGIIDYPEECDNGASNTNSPCSVVYGGSSCTYCDKSCASHTVQAPKCGDSLTQSGNGEQCDDGSSNTNTACTPVYPGSCTYCDKSCKSHTVSSSPSQTCNNGIIEGSEECDNGGSNTNSPCTPPYGGSCTYCDRNCASHTVNSGSSCGNGITEGSEECDNGGSNTNSACSPPYGGSCTYCDTSCNSHTVSSTARCGNGITEGSEECDDGSSNTNSCNPPYGGTCYYCDTSCYSQSVTSTARCGDGMTQGPEQCDNGGSNTDTPCYASWGGSCSYCDTSCESHTVPGSTCYISNAVITPSTGCTGNRCIEGNKLSVTLTTVNDCTPSIETQVDFMDGATPATSTCIISASGGDMDGITKSLNNPTSPITFTYNIPFVPAGCLGKNLRYVSASLTDSTGNYWTPTTGPKVYSNKLTSNIVLSNICFGLDTYSTRIGFEEAPIYLVDQNKANTITYVCSNPMGTSAPSVYTPVTTARTTGDVHAIHVDEADISVNRNPGPVCRDTPSMDRYCLEKGLGDRGMLVSPSGYTSGPCVRWSGTAWTADSNMGYGPITCRFMDLNGYTKNVAFAVDGVPYTYGCSPVADGVCPNDFLPGACTTNPDGTSNDFDCGNHSFVKCLNITNYQGATVRNTCQYVSKPAATNPTCGIQINVSRNESLHTQCLNGAVVTDNATGCPYCLKPGQAMTYGEYVYKYVGTTRIQERATLNTSTTPVGGKYYACPLTDKYNVTNKGSGVGCYVINDCDQGVRVGSDDSLLVNKCDQPVTLTGGRYILNPNCIFTNAGKYTRYCGLDSWYKNYEVYANKYRITVT
jgi:hypothetical protein